MGSTRDTLKRRVRKTVRWSGLVLAVLLLAVWIVSTEVRAAWRVPGGDWIGVWGGLARYYVAVPTSDPLPYKGIATGSRPTGLGLWFDWGNSRFGPFFAVPLWFPALLSFVARTWAYRADMKYLRRVREGACPACGYDRAGLAAVAVCPECGSAGAVGVGP